jgi:hypothetical protein
MYACDTSAAQHSVHPTGGSLRVFRHFAWLKAGSVKGAVSHPAHQRVTPAVGRTNRKDDLFLTVINLLNYDLIAET